MRNLIEKDGLLKFMFNDLISRGDEKSEDRYLEILFNSEVLGDSIMEDNYLNMSSLPTK